MEAVGYDLYCKMLHEAVKEARGEAPAEQFETSVDIRTDAFIPSTYIANESQKLDMYKRIAGIETDEEAEEMLEELIDRFGEPPKSVQNLLTIARLKAVAHSVYIKEIVQREDLLKILMYEKAKIHAQRIPELVKTFAPSLKFAADPKDRTSLTVWEQIQGKRTGKFWKFSGNYWNKCTFFCVRSRKSACLM